MLLSWLLVAANKPWHSLVLEPVLCLHMAFSLCVCVSLYVHFLSYKDTSR